MDPRQKDRGLAELDLPEEEIKKAIDDFERYFWAYSVICAQPIVQSEPFERRAGEDIFLKHCSSGEYGRSQNELAQYLQESRAEARQEPVAYWHVNSKRFPVLSRMARDILAFPATSCATERMFSNCRDHLGVRRNRLNEEIFQALMFLEGNGFGNS